MNMQWTGSLLLFFTLSIFAVIDSHGQPTKCPNVNELKETSINEREEFIKALHKIVPQTYTGELAKSYTNWRVITATPFPLTTENEKDKGYYGMAKNFCGKAVADRSWLARLYFSKWEGKSASNLEGQIFLAKSKEKGWFVWFRCH
jgi:hypothetical protein